MRKYFNRDHDYTTNAPSYYDELGRKYELIKELSQKVWQYDKTLAEKLQLLKETMEHYSDLIDGKIEDFDDIILSKTEQWIDDNLEDILTQAVQIVWFGLTDDGYFMAVIPEKWSDVRFDTTADGRLVLYN